MNAPTIESILSSRLAYDYLDWPEHWMDVRPLTSGRALALFNPGEGEVEYYRKLGWDVRIFVFSQGLLLLWHEKGVQVNWLSSRDLKSGDWSLLSEMDAVIMNRGLGMFEDPQLFIDNVLALLPDEKPFYIQIENVRFYQNLINISSRENPPCRNYYVRTGDFTREEVTQLLKNLDHLNNHSWEDDRDQRFFDEGRDRYKTVTGPDCYLRLPFDHTRDDYFIKHFRLKLIGEQDILSALPKVFSQHAQPQVIRSEDNMSLDEVTLKSVEEKIQLGDIIGAVTLFKQIEIFPNGEEQHAITNMKGLLAFYQGHFEDAFFHFIDALEVVPYSSDYFLNLNDAAIKFGRQSEVQRLFKIAVERFPELKSIENEINP